MEFAGNGELVPVGGGDAIPLVRTPLVLGRRESCDVCLPFPNISGRHCELYFKDGFWWIRDLNSQNGLKINGERLPATSKKILAPEDTISLGKRDFKIEYVPADRMSRMEELMEDEEEDIMGVGLLEKAGLEQPQDPRDRARNHPKTKPDWEEYDDDDEDDD
jgi:pSer/pThr/pTyr-binding forkhead associated (FHA) protein